MPKVANGIHLDADLSRAHSENMEFEIHRAVIRHQEGVLRLLAYVNHANMGSYREAIDNFRAGLTPVPDITAHPLQTTIKYGFGAHSAPGLRSGSDSAATPGVLPRKNSCSRGRTVPLRPYRAGRPSTPFHES